jgi:hypothetical protein
LRLESLGFVGLFVWKSHADARLPIPRGPDRNP